MLEETIYELLRGPLVSVSAAGCLLGILFQFIRFWFTCRKIPEFCCQSDTRPTPRTAGASIARPHSIRFAKLRQTALGRAPDIPCAWQEIYDRLKRQNRLENITEVWPATDWLSQVLGVLIQPGFEAVFVRKK